MATQTRATFTSAFQSQNPKPFPASFVNRMYDFFDRRTRCATLPYYRDIAARRGPDPIGRRQAAALRTHRRPALVIWGEKDPYIPKSVAYEQHRAFPGARVEIIPNAGHWPWIDYPRRVEALVIPFLRRALAAPEGGSAPGGTATAQPCAGRRPTIVGTGGPDTLRGTPDADVIAAGAGRDTVRAGGGDDLVCAGSGPDDVAGQDGDDRLAGGWGADRLAGGAGDDGLDGSTGRDRCHGGAGADRVRACEG